MVSSKLEIISNDGKKENMVVLWKGEWKSSELVPKYKNVKKIIVENNVEGETSECNLFVKINKKLVAIRNKFDYNFYETLSNLCLSKILSIDVKSIGSKKIEINIYMFKRYIGNEENNKIKGFHSKHKEKLRYIMCNIYPNSCTREINDTNISDNFIESVVNGEFFQEFKDNVLTTYNDIDDDLLDTKINVKLYHYQKCGISWMRSLEKKRFEENSIEISCCKLVKEDDYNLYYNNYSGIIYHTVPKLNIQSINGGILADEVGLGKTLEILGLILCHPYSVDCKEIMKCNKNCIRCSKKLDKCLYKKIKELNKKYYNLSSICYECMQEGDIYNSRCTLVICPESLISQWENEIISKINEKSISYIIYNGIINDQKHPYFYLDYDIILTSYNILSREYHHSELSLTRSHMPLRNITIPVNEKITPLTYVDFWRVVYDESQIAENKGNMAQMCCYIRSKNRWCVSGTPIHKTINELQCIFSLLNYYPLMYEDDFKLAFYHELSLDHIDLLVSILKSMFRRVEKNDILEQLQIPGVSHQIIKLDFDPIELHHFLDFHADSSHKMYKLYLNFLKKSVKKKIPLSSYKQFYTQFNTLRKLCSEPFHLLPKKNDSQKFDTYSMSEAMVKLIDKKKTECEERFRTLLFYRNGLAGSYMLCNNEVLACDIYKSSIKLMNEHKEHFGIDKTQRIHVLHNLTKIEQNNHFELRNELRISLEDFLDKPTRELRSNKEITNNIVSSIKQLEDDLSIETIINRVFDSFSDTKRNSLINKIPHALRKEYLTDSPFVNRFTFDELKTYIIKQFEYSRELLLQSLFAIYKLEDSNRKVVLRQVKKCCLDTAKTMEEAEYLNRTTNESDCHFCQVESYLLQLENSLYEKTKYDKKQKNVEGMTGFRAKKDIDVILNTIFGSNVEASSNNVIINWLKLTKKCLTSLRTYFVCVRNWFTAQDQLISCCKRVQIKDLLKDYGTKVDETTSAKIDLVINLSINTLTSSIDEKEKEVETLLRQLKYFRNLHDLCDNKTGLIKEVCPICYDEIGDKWLVLLCSHFLCMTCYSKSQKLSQQSIIDCPLCRCCTDCHDVFFIDTQKQCEKSSSSSSVKINGCSTKINAVYSIICDILKNTNDKILIFSEWDTSLDMIYNILQQENIYSLIAKTVSNLKCMLRIFINDAHSRILLMNIRLGSKGINITCANHVIFVEICPNIHDEIQAIGRCHRIGQTKPIIVYHPFIRNSIEEKLLNGREENLNLFKSKHKRRINEDQIVKMLKLNQNNDYENLILN